MTKIVRSVIASLKNKNIKTKPDGTKYINVPKEGLVFYNDSERSKFDKIVNESGFKAWHIESVGTNYNPELVHHYEMILV